LAEHAKTDVATFKYLQSVFINGFYIVSDDDRPCNADICDILFQADITPTHRTLRTVTKDEHVNVWRLFVQHFDIYPFPHDPLRCGDIDCDDEYSLFCLAAHQKDTELFSFFVEVWNQRFADSSSGSSKRDAHGNAPIDIICRDARVSIQAVTLLVENKTFTANLSTTAAHGSYPFQSAVKAGASLDVIFYLLKHWPDALAEPLPIDRGAPTVVNNNSESLLAAAADNELLTLLTADNEATSLTAQIEFCRQLTVEKNGVSMKATTKISGDDSNGGAAATAADERQDDAAAVESSSQPPVVNGVVSLEEHEALLAKYISLQTDFAFLQQRFVSMQASVIAAATHGGAAL
jgi:hypothetical protein